MNTIRYVLLKGKEDFINHPKSIERYNKLFWTKANKKLNVGDIVFLFLSGKGHKQLRYKLEVTSTSVTRIDKDCWVKQFKPDNDCFEFSPVAAMYKGNKLGYDELESIGISSYTQYCELTLEQVQYLDKYFV